MSAQQLIASLRRELLPAVTLLGLAFNPLKLPLSVHTGLGLGVGFFLRGCCAAPPALQVPAPAQTEVVTQTNRGHRRPAGSAATAECSDATRAGARLRTNTGSDSTNPLSKNVCGWMCRPGGRAIWLGFSGCVPPKTPHHKMRLVSRAKTLKFCSLLF